MASTAAQSTSITRPPSRSHPPRTCIHDVQDVTLALRAFVEAWSWTSVNVIGHSFGAMLAAELAVTAPHLVRNLVLVDLYGLWKAGNPVTDVFALTAEELIQAKWYDTANQATETNVAPGGRMPRSSAHQPRLGHKVSLADSRSRPAPSSAIYQHPNAGCPWRVRRHRAGLIRLTLSRALSRV